MKNLIVLLLLLPNLLFAQSYRQLADSALKIMNSSNDSVAQLKNYPIAYALYQKAFHAFPDKVDKIGLYKAGYLAGELGDKNAAFDYLEKVIDKDFWEVVTGKYAVGEFSAISKDPRWPVLVQKARSRKKIFMITMLLKQHKLEASGINQLAFNDRNATAVYQKIKSYNQYPPIKDKYLSMVFPINDSLHTAYLIAFPPHYNPAKKYPLLFFLHGAVNSNTGYLDVTDGETETTGWNRFYTKYATTNNVIMVYPHGNRDYNWMYPDKGFFMIPAILKQIKQFVNVDDNRVFITGHSNGATGSFSYLMKQPSPFAAFYGFNTRPRVATGGSFIRNILNRSYFNVSTDSDYYYPPGANDSLTKTMNYIGADYQDHRYNGFPHWFPQFDASEPAHKILFEDMATRKRNPFKPNIYWECDELQYGGCDWLKITAFDTLAKRAEWQSDINFTILKWKLYDKQNKLVTRDTMMNGFNYRHRSGAVKATFKNNVFIVETSDIRSFRLFISPEMVDLNKPVSIIVNGKLYVRQPIKIDKDFMIANFKNTLDRSAIWVNYIDVNLE
jgi:predicted esterase